MRSENCDNEGSEKLKKYTVSQKFEKISCTEIKTNQSGGLVSSILGKEITFKKIPNKVTKISRESLMFLVKDFQVHTFVLIGKTFLKE